MWYMDIFHAKTFRHIKVIFKNQEERFSSSRHGLAPSTYMVAHNLCNSSPRRSNPLFRLP